MFEIGKSYEIVTLETGQDDEGKSVTYESSSVYEVAAVDGTLVKLLGPDWSTVEEYALPPDFDRNRPRDETIINTACLFFLRAELRHE